MHVCVYNIILYTCRVCTGGREVPMTCLFGVNVCKGKQDDYENIVMRLYETIITLCDGIFKGSKSEMFLSLLMFLGF